MIEIDYNLERDLGSRREIYNADLFKNKPFHELSEISADNDNGKSTFLQIIAMSFGASNENVSDELLGKINRLNKSYQKLTYSLKIDNPNFDYICEIEKPKKDKKEILFSKIYRKGNNKTEKLSKTSVRNKYKLIYDIPNDPLSRLRNLVDDLGDFQKEIIPKLQTFMTELNWNIEEIKNQPTKSEVDEIKTNIDTINDEIDTINDEIENNEKLHKALKILLLIRSYKGKNSDFNKTDKKLSEVRKINKDQGPKPKEINTRDRTTIYLNLESQMDNIERDSKELFNLLDENYSDEMNFDTVKKKYDNIDFSDLNNKGPESSTISYFLNKATNFLSNLNNKISSEQDRTNLAFYRDIIDVFERFKNNNPKIPGVKFTANEMITKIRKEIDQLGGLSDYQEEANDAAEDLIKTIKNNKDGYFDYYLKNKEKLKPKKQTKSYIDYSIKINDLKSERDQHKKDKGITLKQLVKLGITDNEIDTELHKIANEHKDLAGLTNQNVISNKKIDSRNNVKDNKRTRERRKALLRDLKIELGVKEKQLKKENPFSKHLELLQSYLEPATELSHRLNEMEKLIQKMKTNDDLPNDNFTKKYIDMVNEFLAEKMQFVMHEGKKHSLKTVNYQEDYFITTDDIKLHFDDFGTGHSQVNYLKSLLERNYNNPMIVLLDETGNMSEKTIKVLYTVLKKLYNDGKILAGFLVKPGLKPIVKSII